VRCNLSDASTVTVYLVQPGCHHTKINHTISAFRTDVLDRYCSTRLHFTIQEDPKCNHECTNSEDPQPLLMLAPCLAVSNQWTCDYEHLKCMYPQCKTMIINDEMCGATSLPFDVRQYYTTNGPPRGHLPRWPRWDLWLFF
jgi:hypothetical protein